MISEATRLLAESDSGSVADFAVVFLAAGFVFYGAMYLRYRNANRRHHHERETDANLHDVKGHDHLVRSLSGLSNSRMEGANHDDVRGSLHRFFG